MKIDLPAKILKDRVGERFTFIGEDTFKLLKTYLGTLGKLDDDDYIFQPEKGPKDKKPLPPTTFSNYFRKIALALGITERKVRGKPFPVRLYCLRRNILGIIAWWSHRYENFGWVIRWALMSIT